MNIEWTAERRKVADLHEWEENPRTITDDQFEALKESIRARGFHDIVKIDTDGTILSGTQRKRALSELGVEEMWAMIPGRPLTHEERQQIVVESNLHRGKFDFDMLGNGFDVSMLLGLGMSKFELDLLPKPEKVQIDNEGLTKSLDSYQEGNIKQIVLFFKNSDFDDIVRRMDEVQKETGTDNHTDAFLKLLDFWETHSHASPAP